LGQLHESVVLQRMGLQSERSIIGGVAMKILFDKSRHDYQTNASALTGAMNSSDRVEHANETTRPKTLRGLAAALVALPLLVACASNQPASYTVSQAVAAPDDSNVVVTGAVVQQTDKEHLLIRDSTGQIIVQVDDDMLGKVKFAPDSEVRIAGTIDRDSERSVLIAKSVQVIK
jgi:uncharacterized protein (TIGR00156 family)